MKEQIKLMHQLIHNMIIEWNIDNIDLMDTDYVGCLRALCYQYCFDKLNDKLEFENEFQKAIKNNISEIPPVYNDHDIIKLTEHINFLKSLPQPEQRTPEWYEFRSNRLTASDLARALGLSGYKSLHNLILKKCGVEFPFIAGSAIKHGVKFEDVAIMIYELRNNVKVDEYGCVPHPTLAIFGASPDGIVSPESENRNYIGRMLEIKCPYSRIITNIIKVDYDYQIQGQLEVCDLEYCDFLECDIKEYSNEDEYWNDEYCQDKDYRDKDCNDEKTIQIMMLNTGYNSLGMEKGILIEYFNKTKKKIQFFYAPFGITREEFNIWEDEHLDITEADENLEYLRTTYWKLKEYNVKLVKRDRTRWACIVPQIKEFWDKVVECRNKGIKTVDGLSKNTVIKHKKSTKSRNTYQEINLSNKFNRNKPKRQYQFLPDPKQEPKPESKPKPKREPKQEPKLELEQKQTLKKIRKKIKRRRKKNQNSNHNSQDNFNESSLPGYYYDKDEEDRYNKIDYTRYKFI